MRNKFPQTKYAIGFSPDKKDKCKHFVGLDGKSLCGTLIEVAFNKDFPYMDYCVSCEATYESITEHDPVFAAAMSGNLNFM